ncbi:MAG: RimK/LysX family protein [Desulfosalsimonadaceae bacterium]
MTGSNRFFAKVLMLLLLICFAAGCGADSFFLQKKDLSAVSDKVAVLEKRMDLQAGRTELLLEQYKKQQKLLDTATEQNSRFFQALEEQIQQAHTDTCRRLKELKSSSYPKPAGRSGTPPMPETYGTDKILVGRVEKVRLTPPDHVFQARIDTGATTSSLDGREMEKFERDGSPWVRFKLQGNEGDALYEIEKPIVRHVRIVQASTSESDRRPVVKLQCQIGRIKVIEEFSLEKRAHLDYQVLVGRNILRDLMVVDVAQKFIVPLPEPKPSGDSPQ